MKNNITFLRDWLITLCFTTLLWDFIGGIFLTVARFIFSKQAQQYLFFGILGTVVFCCVLAIKSYMVSLDINGKRIPVSMAMPISSMIIAWGIYIVVYIISGCNYIVGPVAHSFVTVFFGNGVDQTFIYDISLSQHLSVFVPLGLLYISVSLGAYILAKVKQEHHNKVVLKLREEDKQKKSNDLFEEALKNGLGNRNRH